ncbi:hypothetical protein Glove_86g10 [Diversispora epigaea]|uniref:Protein kinase domain-containing protein n=1 Tax=Diversispora epigaea TaxID=1348612 RepID=A0A397J7D3_9GLOM|nr:hypothetical protein Glove_86g10 [Diversispora epigaea]
MASNICQCNQEFRYKWCKPCNSKHFQNDFNNWTSGNDKIDKFIQDAQLNANRYWEVVEWIPYSRFKDVKQIGKDRDEDGINVALKKFDNFVNFNEVLNEMEIHFKTYSEYATGGNLREYLKINFNNINWYQKLNNLWLLSLNLMRIHELDIVHQDFYPGNILLSDFKIPYYILISDFGLSKLIEANPNNPVKKNIVGVLPYIAQILNGDEEYTKAADIYSFGIIAHEMTTGFSPYPDIPHDEDLAIKICNGLRPKIPFHTPKLITRVIMKCWDARVTHRPTFKELFNELRKYYWDSYYYLKEGKNNDSNIRNYIEVF